MSKIQGIVISLSGATLQLAFAFLDFTRNWQQLLDFPFPDNNLVLTHMKSVISLSICFNRFVVIDQSVRIVCFNRSDNNILSGVRSTWSNKAALPSCWSPVRLQVSHISWHSFGFHCSPKWRPMSARRHVFTSWQ